MICIRETFRHVDVTTYPIHFYTICFNCLFKNYKLNQSTYGAGVLEPATEEKLRGRTLTRGWRKPHKEKPLVTCVGYVTTMWGQGNPGRILVGTTEGKALLYLSEDVVKRLAAVSSQHGLSQDVDK